jgi:uncharacterized protein (DUF885 family)
MTRYFSAFALTAVLLAAPISCAPPTKSSLSQAEYVERESRALNGWFDDRFDDELARSPMSQTSYGDNSSLSRLDDVSQQSLDEEAALLRGWRQDLTSTFDLDRLDEQTRLSYELFLFDTDDRLAEYDFADHDYVFQHMSGPHSNLPSFLINIHPISTIAEAEGYIARLGAAQSFLGQYEARAEAQAAKGILLPRFVYPKLIESAQNIITGRPFDGETDSPLLGHFKDKVDALDVGELEKTRLVNDAARAISDYVGPAYNNLIAMFRRHEGLSDDRDGVWKLPRGANYYQSRLNHYTTTDLTADEIHNIGLNEVARIQDQMREIMTQIGYEGSLKEFFTFLRTDPQFTYANDDAGRARYIEEASGYIDDMREELDRLFITKPKADIVVKRVEPFREASAFGAFYNQPALDGSRPGTYYINLKDMSELPIYQMQALAYHEGIPGHHMQIAIGMELKGLPKFRTLGGHTPYIEGWALYAESVPADLGLYTDPYQDFGRLSMEIFRAVRLVVDTAIHSKKWTREQAVQYFLDNSANSEGDIRAEIDRYIVWPGQATAYKIGMIKITELRLRAETELGDDFDITEFHDVILANGSVPLSILDRIINNWIQTKKR